MTDFAPDAVSRIVSVTKLSSLVMARPEEVIVMKLDTEGLEPALLEETKHLRGAKHLIPIFEFMPWRYGAGGAKALIADLSPDFTLFDIGYTPNPWTMTEVRDPDALIREVESRPFGYTDLIGIPKSMPGSADLTGRISRMRPRPPTLQMI